MSFDRDNPVVGDIVYRRYRVSSVGKIIKIVSNRPAPINIGCGNDPVWVPSGGKKVLVRWSRKGNPEEAWSSHMLYGLEDLIDEHKKKIKTLTTKMKKAQKL